MTYRCAKCGEIIEKGQVVCQAWGEATMIDTDGKVLRELEAFHEKCKYPPVKIPAYRPTMRPEWLR